MTPSGVFQGYDGDCWFDSAVGVIAKTDPAALEKMVKDNGNGTYTFTFHEPNAQGGYTPVPITVDGNLYAMEHTPKSTGQAELYLMKALFMPLLEKAFAQFRGGSYAMLEGGFGAMGMSPILGRPAYNIMFDSTMPPDRLWSILEKGTATNTPMTLGTLSTTPKEDRDAAGLVGGHAYMVTGIKEEDGKKLVEVRNPWGDRGVGTDTSPESANVEVPLETVLKLFHDVSACPAPGVDIGINTPDADIY
jgi:hypothetical protein